MSAAPEATPAGSEVSVGDHLAADDDAPVDPGTYRVVGTAGDEVTLLEVRNEAGRRVHSGRITTVEPAALDRLRDASNPDSGWGKLRQIPRQYAAHPVETTLSVALLGYAGAVEVGVPGLPTSFQDTAVLIAVLVLGFMAMRA